ncbi:MAG TPA: I78 family peptidase inhibitor [Vicinamibacterales bacterium]|nr:I78 family peptidase inhibitor [Vicinamibacterales bacterium]
MKTLTPRAWIALAVVAAGACAANQSAPQSPSPIAVCDATQVQFAVGRPASSELLERARLAAHAATARFLRPNEAITLEFLASRLNLNLNERAVVLSGYCG